MSTPEPTARRPDLVFVNLEWVRQLRYRLVRDAPAIDELVTHSELVKRVASLMLEREDPFWRTMLLRWFQRRSPSEAP